MRNITLVYVANTYEKKRFLSNYLGVIVCPLVCSSPKMDPCVKSIFSWAFFSHFLLFKVRDIKQHIKHERLEAKKYYLRLKHFKVPKHEKNGCDLTWKNIGSKCKQYLSRLMGKPTICIGENKDADQLRGNREADQRLCFRYSDSTIPLLHKSEISSF